MKSLILSLFLILWGGSLYSQKEKQMVLINSEDTLKLLSGVFEFRFSILDENSPQFIDGVNKNITSGNKVRILFEKERKVFFQYLNFKSDSLRKLFNQNKVFYIDTAVFSQITRPIYGHFKGVDAGAYTIPFRLRGVSSEDFDFEASLSLQSNVVFGFGSKYQTRSWLDASVGIGVTGVNLNSKNSNVTEERTATAFTTSLGLLVKPTDVVNFGLFLGWDFLGKNDEEVSWIHDTKPWIGLGINITFNKIDNPTPSKKSGQ